LLYYYWNPSFVESLSNLQIGAQPINKKIKFEGKLIKLKTMIKKILFISSLFCVGFASAQSFKLMDHNDVDVSNTTHYEYGTNSELSQTKFHIQNLTSSQVSFALKVEKQYVPYSNSSLSCCFGTACFSASASVAGSQVINSGVGDDIVANGTYTDLKISPITWPWIDCSLDSAVWIVTIYDPANPSDEVTTTIVWRCGDAPTAVEEVSKSAVKLSAFPNPASADLTINYSINASYNKAEVKVYDVLGQEVVSRVLDAKQGQVDLNVSNLNAGVYFYAIKVDEQTIRTERIIVQ